MKPKPSGQYKFVKKQLLHLLPIRKMVNSYRKNYKIFLLIAFTIGLTAGMLFQKSDYISEPSNNQGEPIIKTSDKITRAEPGNNYIPTNSTIFPASINVNEKATFTISYANRSSAVIRDIQLLLISPPGSNLMFSSREGAEFNKIESERSTGQVFDLPDLEADNSRYISFFVYSSVPGTHAVRSQIRSGQAKPINIDQRTITIK